MPEFTGAGEEPIPIGLATPNAEVVIDDAVHPRPLVPREAAPKADGGVRAREIVGIADHFLLGRAELDLVEAAMPTTGRPPLSACIHRLPFSAQR